MTILPSQQTARASALGKLDFFMSSASMLFAVLPVSLDSIP